MRLYNPGPDAQAGDLWNEDPRGTEAPRRSLGEDTRVVTSRNQD